MTVRRSYATLAAGAFCAILTPIWLLWPPLASPPPAPPADRISVQDAPEIGLPGDRRLFAGGGDAAHSDLPADAPDLAGIVGRPPHDAVVLIRTSGGSTRTLAPGQSYAGWRLEAVSAEAALFSRGARQIRVPMPAPDPGDDAAPQ